jgi:hypothetical protein
MQVLVHLFKPKAMHKYVKTQTEAFHSMLVVTETSALRSGAECLTQRSTRTQQPLPGSPHHASVLHVSLNHPAGCWAGRTHVLGFRESPMRLWSIHPQYLDAKGLVAVWREGLLAQAVLAGQTKGYQNHPQLTRFRQSSTPQAYIAAYLKEIHVESLRRGYHFDEHKIGELISLHPLSVTTGQLDYEWIHLTSKLKFRAPEWLRQFESIEQPVPHPVFHVIKGGTAPWEVVRPDLSSACRNNLLS